MPKNSVAPLRVKVKVACEERAEKKVEKITPSTCPSCDTVTDFLYDFRGEWVCNDCYHRRTIEHYASLGVNLVALRRRLDGKGDEEEAVEEKVRWMV